MKKAAAVALLSALITFSAYAFAAQVILKSGRVLQGKITEQSDAGVTIKDADGLETKIPCPLHQRQGYAKSIR